MCTFGNILKELIPARGVTQVDLANYLGVTQQTVSHYVNDKREPDLKTFYKICKYFEINTQLVLGEMCRKAVEGDDTIDNTRTNCYNFIIR